jgi:hypothetical protein
MAFRDCVNAAENSLPHSPRSATDVSLVRSRYLRPGMHNDSGGGISLADKRASERGLRSRSPWTTGGRLGGCGVGVLRRPLTRTSAGWDDPRQMLSRWATLAAAAAMAWSGQTSLRRLLQGLTGMRPAWRMPPSSSLALGRPGAEETERERLGLLAELYDTLTNRQLDGIGVAEGWRCLDAGAGAVAVSEAT